ncbi:hypothetical protein BgiMline_014376, partial [Biomphalaria glabrata]
SVGYSATTNGSQENIANILADDNDTTCIVLEAEQLIVDFNSMFFTSWLRFVTLVP